MRQGLITLLLLSALLSAGGCVVIPVPTAEDRVLAGTPVRPEQLAFLTPGTTTRDDVARHVGQPNVIWEDARVHVYLWDMRQGILFWAVGGMAGGTTTGNVGMTDIPKHYLLLLQFDDAGRLLRFERTSRPLNQPLADFLTEWAASSSTRSPDRRAPDQAK